MKKLLMPDEASPVTIANAHGRSPLLLTGDHGGNRIPRRLGTLGVSAVDQRRHIAWDIGIAELGMRLSERLDATFVHQAYSRLAIDCNRAPDAAEAIPESSDGTVIPGNQRLSADDRYARIAELHTPYHAAIAAAISRRSAAGQPTILIALHSFTPRMQGTDRPWHIGVLHGGGDAAFAYGLLQRLSARPDLCVGDNQPYAMDSTDFTVPRHAFAARLPYAEIEIRQDLLGDTAGIAHWCDILATSLADAAEYS